MVFQSDFFLVAFGFDDPKPYLFPPYMCVRSWSGNYIAIFLDEKDLVYIYIYNVLYIRHSGF